MKKTIQLAAMIVLLIIACTIFIGDGLTYLIASLMALAIMGTIRFNRSRAMKITRWAKANPKKAQVYITVLQIALMALGIIAGNNFKELGYTLSDTTAYIFSAIMVIGFLSVPFLPKRSTIAIPKEVNKHRFAFMGIALSSFVMMVYTGNRIGDIFPNSPITHAIEAIDRAIFPDNNTPYSDLNDATSEPANSRNYGQVLVDESSTMAVFASYNLSDKESITPSPDLKKESKANLKAEKKAKKFEKKKARIMHRFEKHRVSLAAGLTAGAVLLIILLVLVSCAGACLIVGGISLLISGEVGGILAILGGLGILFLAIMGIRQVSKKDKEKTKAKAKS